MRLLITIIILFSVEIISGQKYEYVYKNKHDSTYNCYLKVIPDVAPIKGLIIRDYSSLPDFTSPSPFKFTDLCAREGLMTLYTVSSNKFPELFISDTAIAVLDAIIAEVVHEYEIPKNNLFMGGISASGTRALRYAQYCEQGKSEYGIKLKGVFSVDSPLDLARFYESVHNHGTNFKEGMLWEAELMKTTFSQVFGGPPTKFEADYRKASVFSHSENQGGNAKYLKKVNIILYHEPDIDWWLKERGSTYFDINSYDIVAFTLRLWSLGNKNVELVTTSGKGFDRNGNKNCHSWTIVDENDLTQWIIRQLE